MSDIRSWLDGLGLAQYADAFQENAVDLEVLPKLTEDHLEKMGVPLGHRIKILDQAKTLVAAEASTADDPVAEPARDAERRQLTVMFCDLVGSTALSEQLDPEDLRGLMQAYQKACGTVITRYDGHVAQYLGDGLMVYFGWPAAHEDDAERAVRAGLEIVDAVKTVVAPAPLQVRLGVATGSVVVGEGTDAEANRLAVGETPNLAARLQGLAGPDQMVIGPGTHRLISGVFDYDDLGARNLKGILEPVPAWRVRGARAVEGRFEAHTAGGLTPYVGREAERQLLRDRWQRAKDGEGQVVLLSGEPGIGKSRITRELREDLAGEPLIRLRYQCSPYHVNSAFYPVIDQLERASGFEGGDDVDRKLDKLEAALAPGTGDKARSASLLAALLSLSVERYPPLNLSPQRQKEDTITALVEQVVAFADQQPMYLLFEDAHWCDPTTLEAVTAVIGRIEAVPVLMVITYRPEFDPPWTGHGHVVAQSLSRLGRRQGAELVERVTGGKSLPRQVLDQIVEKTDGVPLFVEELTKTVIEAGILKEGDGGYRLDGDLPATVIPTTLRDSLTARLDRLSPVKEIAQIGACIGREFNYRLLASVSRTEDNQLRDGLQQLVNSELIFRLGPAADGRYIFKHALVQDAAYESLLKTRRIQIHARIAEVLESEYPDTVANEPDLLAHHLTEAGLPLRAIPAWLDAARKTIARNSIPEAIQHSTAGLALIPGLDDQTVARRHEVDLLSVKANSHMIASGYSSDEFEEALLRANQVCRDAEFDSDRVSVMWGLSLNAMNRARFDLARERIREMIEVGEAVGTRDANASSRFCAAAVAYWSGDWDAAKRYVAETFDTTSSGEHHALTQTLGHEPYSTTIGFQALLALHRGDLDQALADAEKMIKESEQVDHAFNLCFNLLIMSDIYIYLGHESDARDLIARASQIGGEQSLTFINFMMAPMKTCIAAAEYGGFEQGIETYRNWLPVYDMIGGRILRQQMAFSYALCHAGIGHLDEAWAASQTALEHCRDFSDEYMRAEAYRVAGEVARLRTPDDLGTAEAYLVEAVEAAKARDLKYWELRAAISLAKLWRDTGRSSDARALLAPIYGWFSSGLDTPDLKAARALLEELG